MTRNVLLGSVFSFLLIVVGVLLYLNFFAPLPGAPIEPAAPAEPAAAATAPGATPPGRPTRAGSEVPATAVETPPRPSPVPAAAGGKTSRAVLYFQGKDVSLLFPEEREVATAGDANGRARALLAELARGPVKDLLPTLPAGTRLREVYFDAAGIAYVDFSREIRDLHPGGSSEELMTVDSVVNTLARNLATVQAVQFLIEGRPVATLAGHVDLSLPLRPRAALLAEGP